MTTLHEAAQQALEFLDAEFGWSPGEAPRIDALRAALAQQDEPVEPVAWLQPKTVDAHTRPDLGYETCSKTDYGAFPVYTSPPRRKPLTEEEILKATGHCGVSKYTAVNIARAVERAHGIGEQS